MSFWFLLTYCPLGGGCIVAWGAGAAAAGVATAAAAGWEPAFVDPGTTSWDLSKSFSTTMAIRSPTFAWEPSGALKKKQTKHL